MIRWIVLTALLVALVTGCSSAPAAKAPDLVADLLAQHGWKPTGPRKESKVKLPDDFRLGQGFPWRLLVDYSADVGLDLAAHAGQEVRQVSVPVEDLRTDRLQDLKQHVNFHGVVLLDLQSGQPVGAYLGQVGKHGEPLSGAPGPSLSGRNREEITGLSFFEWSQKYRRKTPPPEVLAAEKPRNAIYDYFRAASAHNCDALWALTAQSVRSQGGQQAWCEQYAPLASVRVVEIEGYAKADNPQGFRFLGSDVLAEQYYVILEIHHKPGERSEWQEGNDRRLIPLVQEGEGQWRLGAPSPAPVH